MTALALVYLGPFLTLLALDRTVGAGRSAPVSAAHEASHVVYIVGWGRSGSTLLTAVLGELDGAFAAGELRMLWGRGAIGRRLCGCGRVIPECPIWSQVLERLDGAPCTAEEMASIQAHRLRSRHFLPELLRMAVHRGPDEELSRYAATYVQALEAVTEVTGAQGRHRRVEEPHRRAPARARRGRPQGDQPRAGPPLGGGVVEPTQAPRRRRRRRAPPVHAVEQLGAVVALERARPPRRSRRRPAARDGPLRDLPRGPRRARSTGWPPCAGSRGTI